MTTNVSLLPEKLPDRIVLWSKGVSPHWYFIAEKSERPDIEGCPVYETLDPIVLKGSPEALSHRQDGELLALAEQWERDAVGCDRDGYADAAIVKRECACRLRTLAASPRGVDESRSLKQIPPAKQYPEPDEHGDDTGTCCQWAYIDGFNEGRALVLAALSQPSEPSKSQVKRIALERGESTGLADSGEVGNG